MIIVRRAGPGDAAPVARVYLASFRAALRTVQLVHSDEEVLAWVRDHVIPATEAWVALDGAVVVGMLSLSPGWVEQLYIAPQRRNEGIGRLLLDLAKRQADGPLELWTFQVNELARRFYERNGFVAVELTDGAGNEECEPDVRYRWDPAADPGVDRPPASA